VVSELRLTPSADGVPSDCIVNFDKVRTLPRSTFRRRVTTLPAQRMTKAWRALRDGWGC
jgi:mRNA interferase MazF